MYLCAKARLFIYGFFRIQPPTTRSRIPYTYTYVSTYKFCSALCAFIKYYCSCSALYLTFFYCPSMASGRITVRPAPPTFHPPLALFLHLYDAGVYNCFWSCGCCDALCCCRRPCSVLLILMAATK